MSSQVLEHRRVGFLDDGLHFLCCNRVQGEFYLREELLVSDHLLLWLDHRVPYPVFEVPPDELDRVEVGGTRREEEHSHSQVSQKLDYPMRMVSSMVI